MTTATSSKEIRSIDLANDSLVKGLASTLNEKAQGEWFAKACAMLETQEISVRGLKATIAKAENSTWLKESHVPYFVNASILRAKSGGSAQPLKKVITTVQDAKRVLGVEFKAELDGSRSFKQFADTVAELKAEEAESKTRGAGKKTASEKDLKEIAVDADAVITLALGLLQELEGDSALIHNFDNAEKLAKVLKAFTASSRALSVAHPVAS